MRRIPFEKLTGTLLLALPLCSCASSDLGTVPREVIELYDQARPDGVIEMEIDRERQLREIEVEIPVESLPQRVRDAALAQVDEAGVIIGAEREIQGGERLWEVKVRSRGRNWEFIVDDEGEIHEVEKELFRDEAPREVLEAADRALPGGTFKSVELIRFDRDDEVYHVKKSKDGGSYKIVVAPDGRILRRVREQRAEIEIPLP